MIRETVERGRTLKKGAAWKEALGNQAVITQFLNEEEAPLLHEEEQARQTGTEAALVDEKLQNVKNIMNQTYGQLLQATGTQLSFLLDPEKAVIPAYTTIGEPTITVYFQRWFVRKASIGQLVGMANHELGAHNMADLILNRLDSRNCIPMLQNWLSNHNHDDNPSLFHHYQSLLDKNMLLRTQIENTEWPQFMGAFEASHALMDRNRSDMQIHLTLGATHITLDPKDKHSAGCVNDHMEFSSIQALPASDIQMEPRAAVYLLTAFKSAETFVTRKLQENDEKITEQPAWLNDLNDMLFFYFLDIARTWIETNAEGIWHFMNRNLLLSCLVKPLLASSDDAVQAILYYYDKILILDQETVTVPDFLDNQLSEDTKKALFYVYTPVKNRLRHIKTELFKLWSSAVCNRFLSIFKD